MTADAPRAQLIHIETDRRLGHEWDEWDGRPLPGNGDFSAPPGLFFRFAALTIGIGMAVGAAKDRKSTRLNSSHSPISYAVFCLKKQNKTHSTCHQHADA